MSTSPAPSSPQPLRVWPGKTPLLFHVESRRPGVEPHQVHLGAYGGGGSCDCEHFVYRLADKANNRAPGAPAVRCAHIIYARAYFCDEMISRLSQREPCG